jgi:hypothetical protein
MVLMDVQKITVMRMVFVGDVVVLMFLEFIRFQRRLFRGLDFGFKERKWVELLIFLEVERWLDQLLLSLVEMYSRSLFFGAKPVGS